MANAAQNSPKVMAFKKMMTIQKLIAKSWGIQKNKELTFDMILV